MRHQISANANARSGALIADTKRERERNAANITEDVSFNTPLKGNNCLIAARAYVVELSYAEGEIFNMRYSGDFVWASYYECA